MWCHNWTSPSLGLSPDCHQWVEWVGPGWVCAEGSSNSCPSHLNPLHSFVIPVCTRSSPWMRGENKQPIVRDVSMCPTPIDWDVRTAPLNHFRPLHGKAVSSQGPMLLKKRAPHLLYCPQRQACAGTRKEGLQLMILAVELVHVDAGGPSGTWAHSVQVLEVTTSGPKASEVVLGPIPLKSLSYQLVFPNSLSRQPPLEAAFYFGSSGSAHVCKPDLSWHCILKHACKEALKLLWHTSWRVMCGP